MQKFVVCALIWNQIRLKALWKKIVAIVETDRMRFVLPKCTMENLSEMALTGLIPLRATRRKTVCHAVKHATTPSEICLSKNSFNGLTGLSFIVLTL